MTGFIIRKNEIERIKQTADQSCSEMITSIRKCRNLLRAAADDCSFTGEFADAFKTDLREIHLTMLGNAAKIAKKLRIYIQQYISGYEKIDNGADFVLDQEIMEGFSAELMGQGEKIRILGETEKEIVRGISDILYLPLAGLDAAVEEMNHITEKVKDLKAAVVHYERDSKNGLEELFCEVRTFENAVDIIRTVQNRTASVSVGIAFDSLKDTVFLTDPAVLASLEEAGFSNEIVECAAGAGYTAQDLLSMYEICQSQEDRQFLICLVQGDYSGAFLTDPVRVSPAMNVIMADKAYRLFHDNDMVQLQTFMNAVLAGTGGYGLGETLRIDAKKDRDDYLARLYEGTVFLLELNSYGIINGNTDEETKNRNWEYLELAGLWKAQVMLAEDLRFRSDPEMPYRIFLDGYNNTLHSGDIRFLYTEVNHNPFSNGKTVCAIDVHTDILETTDDLVTGKYLSERDKLDAQAGMLLQKVLGGTAAEAFLAVITVVKPDLGTALGLMRTVAAGEMDSADNKVRKVLISSMDDFEKTGSAGLGEVVDGIQSYIRQSNSLAAQMADLDNNYEGALWGSGISIRYEVPEVFQPGLKSYVISGVYNPDYLETIGNWNREGITALLPDADLLQIQSVLSESWYRDIQPDTLPYKMIYGFEEDSILNYSVQEIAEAKREVENVVREAYGSLYGWNIENAF